MKRSKCKSSASWLIEMTKIEMRAALIVKGKSLALQKQVLFPILRNYTFKAQFSKQLNRRDEVNIFFVIYVQLLAGRLNTFRSAVSLLLHLRFWTPSFDEEAASLNEHVFESVTNLGNSEANSGEDSF